MASGRYKRGRGRRSFKKRRLNRGRKRIHRKRPQRRFKRVKVSGFNLFGDKCRMTFQGIAQGTVTGDGVASHKVSLSAWDMNSLANLKTAFTQKPPFLGTFSEFFQHYRVYKVACEWTLLPTVQATPHSLCFVACTNVDNTTYANTVPLSQIIANRWAKIRPLGTYNTQKPTRVRMTFYPAKIFPDSTVKGDNNWMGGSLNGAGAYWTAPTNLLQFQWGIGTLDNTDCASSDAVSYMFKATYYTEFFDRYNLVDVA